jgi:hypothetical protein
MARLLKLKTELGEDIEAGGMGSREGNNSWGEGKIRGLNSGVQVF